MGHSVCEECGNDKYYMDEDRKKYIIFLICTECGAEIELSM